MMSISTSCVVAIVVRKTICFCSSVYETSQHDKHIIFSIHFQGNILVGNGKLFKVDFIN
jgi:hypothetical protein